MDSFHLVTHFTSGIFLPRMESTHAQLQTWKTAHLQPLNVTLQAVAEAMAQAVLICDVEKKRFVLSSYHLQPRAGQEANVLPGLPLPF